MTTAISFKGRRVAIGPDGLGDASGQLGGIVAEAGIGGGLSAALGRGQKIVNIVAGSRTFKSNDPLVADLANEIEAAYPGHVVGVNVPIHGPDGNVVTDADILLQNSILQVKSGGGKGLQRQLGVTEANTGMPTVGYGPNLKPSVVRGIERDGGLVTTDKDVLIEAVKPDP